MKIKIVQSDISLIKASAYYYRDHVLHALNIKTNKRTCLDLWAGFFGYNDFGSLQSSAKNYPDNEVSTVAEVIWPEPNFQDNSFDYCQWQDNVTDNYMQPLSDNLHASYIRNKIKTVIDKEDFGDDGYSSFSAYYIALMFFIEPEETRFNQNKFFTFNSEIAVIKSFYQEFLSWTLTMYQELTKLNIIAMNQKTEDFFLHNSISLEFSREYVEHMMTHLSKDKDEVLSFMSLIEDKARDNYIAELIPHQPNDVDASYLFDVHLANNQHRENVVLGRIATYIKQGFLII